MADTPPPQEVLSEHFQQLMEGKRLVSAVFCSFQFEPAFFEMEILPVFLDVPLSHAGKIRLVQLEDAIRDLPGQIAVYYDSKGLVTGDGSARLDVRRIPLLHRTGVFHAKNVFALLEEEEPDEDGKRSRTLLVATLSANLTKAGWWSNVEVCHAECLGEGVLTRLSDDLLAFLDSLPGMASIPDDEHRALEDILDFLDSTGQRAQRTAGGKLHPHFFGGKGRVADFLADCSRGRLQGARLEIISPFFDDKGRSQVLQELIDRFRPMEVRVFLPRDDAGQARIREDLYESIRGMPGVKWGRLPEEMLRLGKSGEAGRRNVHAKVYRFFHKRPNAEFLFIGSPNLTGAAFQKGGNVETGILVEVEPSGVLDFWLQVDEKTPLAFEPREDEASSAGGASRLQLRYHWDRGVAEAWWGASGASPALRLAGRGIVLATVGPLPARIWTDLGGEVSRALADILEETSFVTVHGDGEKPLDLLVMEEGMSHKPSLLLQLNAADILRYWSLLTAEQRNAFLEDRAASVLRGEDGHLFIAPRGGKTQETLFDRFAGFFHAFASLERSIRAALEGGQEKGAIYRLFGEKYDSLGTLLSRVLEEEGDLIDRYVILLCAQQLLRELRKDFPSFFEDHPKNAEELEGRLEAMDGLRQDLAASDPEEMPAFLEWFEGWFLQRAEALELQA